MKFVLSLVLLLSFASVSLQAAEKELTAEEIATGFYLPAAQDGEPFAQLAIGEIYYKGEDVEKDLVMAYAWFTVSAKQDVWEAEDMQKKAWDEMTPAQREEAKALAAEFSKRFVPAN